MDLADTHYHVLARGNERRRVFRDERDREHFLGRFKSFIIGEETYLERLVLYMHRNPLCAGAAERLADYPWSSYPALAYGRRCPPWFERGRVLGLFGGSAARFRRAAQGYSEEEEKLLEDLRHGFYLGSLEACGRLLERVGLRAHAEQPQSKRLLEPASPDWGVLWRGLLSSRQRPEARLTASPEQPEALASDLK